MVIQEPPRSGEWTAVRPEPLKEEKKPQKEKKSGKASVVAVQSIACVVVVLLALLLRLVGGTAYEQLRQSFHDSLMRNDLLEVLATIWDGDPLASESAPTDTADVQPDGVSTGRVPPTGALAVSLRVNRAAAAPLLQGRVSSCYGYRTDPTGGGEQFHRGVDIAAAAGAPIAAMYEGSVTEVGQSNSLGNYIRLSHGDGLEVLYAHCSTILATQGTKVRAGETVALVGSTGDSTGNHVHIEITVDGTTYNPMGVVPMTRYV